MRFDRRISRRSFLAAAGVTSAALALTACGGSSSSVAASSASGTDVYKRQDDGSYAGQEDAYEQAG